MATKCKLLVVAALAFTALAANDSPASLVAAKEVAEAFGEALKEEQPLLKNAELHKSTVMASKDDLVAALANPGLRETYEISAPTSLPPQYLKKQCTDTCSMEYDHTWCLSPLVSPLTILGSLSGPAVSRYPHYACYPIPNATKHRTVTTNQ
jgi:hypothetical protein